MGARRESSHLAVDNNDDKNRYMHGNLREDRRGYVVTRSTSEDQSRKLGALVQGVLYVGLLGPPGLT